MTYVLTITGATNQTQASNNTSSGAQSGSGAFNLPSSVIGLLQPVRLTAGYFSLPYTGQNRTVSATSTKPITATAATDIPVGGGPSTAAAPFPGESHKDIFGPDDNYISAASHLVGVISSVGVVLVAGVGGWLVFV